jgi:hypothetical protein
MGVLRILGPQGDTTLTWDPKAPEEVEEVRRRFEEIVREGYLVFELDPETRQAERVHRFDPEQKELRAIRPLAGG